MPNYRVATSALLRAWPIAILVVAGCGGDTPSGSSQMRNPAMRPGAAGSNTPAPIAGSLATPPSAAGGSATGAAGSGALPLPGSAGRGTAGVPAAGAGVAGAFAAPAGSAGGASGALAAAGASAAGGGGTGAATGAGGSAAAGSGTTGSGMCCPSGDCVCRGEAPAMLTSAMGPYKSTTMRIAAGTVVYPMDAEPPWSAIAICPGFLNTGPEMMPWGPFYASYGIVTVVTSTGASDQPATRAQKLLAAISQLKEENMKSGSPLQGKLNGRYGTSGYSMGGGGTTIAAGMDKSLKTSIGLAAWGGQGNGIQSAQLLLCGSVDTTAPCSMSQSVYRSIGDSVPKAIVTINGASHFSWFGPQDGERGRSGATALAWQKVFLDGDERWRPALLSSMANPTTVK